MGSRTVRDVVSGREYTITSPQILSNPCGEMVMSEWLLPVSLEGTWCGQPTMGRKGMREWIRTDDEVVVSADHIVSYTTELGEITPQLSEVDIWSVALAITTVTGDDYVVSDLDELIKFVGMNDESGAFSSHDSAPGSLGYYVKNAWRHEEMRKKAEKLSG